ncbi:MAG: DUF5610 domain-containing protein [Planctomycetes bacterium]|nr:DUF5610 domain-containing protein [Planctomycetota bacterium]
MRYFADTKGMDLNNMLAVSSERSVEHLKYQALTFDLELQDNRGRSVSVSFSSEQLDYSRTYDRYGAVANIGGSLDPSTNMLDQVRKMASENISRQGMALIEHQEERLQYQTSELKIEGDVSLLQDYFSSSNTADRILNFVDKLAGAAGIDKNDTHVFDNFMQDIRQGIADGFAQAEHILGSLPEISIETQNLLELLLNQYQEDPQEIPQACDYLEQVRNAHDSVNIANNI